MFLLHNLLRNSASRFPENLAVIAAKESLTYKELDVKSDALASSLLSAGVSPGDPVGVAIHKCIDSVVAVYGILKSGACYVPIDPFAPATRSAAVVANTNLTHIVTTSDRANTLIRDIAAASSATTLTTVLTPGPATAATEPVPDDLKIIDWSESCSESLIAAPITDTHLAYILHTSGSTGLPKGVAITHRNALAFVDMSVEFWQVTQHDRLCSQAPLHFDLSVFDLYVAAKAGAAVVLIPEFFAAFPKKMTTAIDTHGITIWNSVVSTLTLMMERGKPDAATFDSLRVVIFSGEVMPVKYLRKLLQHMKHTRMYNVYGQTEANSSMYYEIDRANVPTQDDWKIPLGKAFPNFEVYALNNHSKAISTPGESGELMVRAGTVATGYWGNPQLSKEKFVIDPLSPESGARTYRTGDLVTLDTQGNYLFKGRTDDMVKTRGYRVELGELDLALASCPDVTGAAAIAVPDDEVGNRLYAFVSTPEDSGLDENMLLSHCRERLPKYMLPERIFVQNELPRTSTNKVDRKRLRSELQSNLKDNQP